MDRSGGGGYSAVKPLLHELIYKYSLMQVLTIITTTKHILFPNFHYLTVSVSVSVYCFACV